MAKSLLFWKFEIWQCLLFSCCRINQILSNYFDVQNNLTFISISICKTRDLTFKFFYFALRCVIKIAAHDSMNRKIKKLALVTKMDHGKVQEFSVAVWGYHYHRSFWNPVTNPKLACHYDENNQFEMFSIKLCGREKIVGHFQWIYLDQQNAWCTEVQFLVWNLHLLGINQCSPQAQGGL